MAAAEIKNLFLRLAITIPMWRDFRYRAAAHALRASRAMGRALATRSESNQRYL